MRRLILEKNTSERDLEGEFALISWNSRLIRVQTPHHERFCYSWHVLFNLALICQLQHSGTTYLYRKYFRFPGFRGVMGRFSFVLRRSQRKLLLTRCVLFHASKSVTHVETLPLQVSHQSTRQYFGTHNQPWDQQLKVTLSYHKIRRQEKLCMSS